MSAIVPNSIVYLLKGVPLEENYDDTFYFNTSTENATTQYNFFYGFRKKSFSNITYIKENKIRVEVAIDEIRDCNYMMYQNTNYGNKWFYAFITKTEYINNIVTEIEFSMDYVQTWYFDIKFEPSFVEREHSSTDGVGDNLIDEPIGVSKTLVTDTKDELYVAETVTQGYKPLYVAVVFYIPDGTRRTVLQPNVLPTRATDISQANLPYKWEFATYDYSSMLDQNIIPWKSTIANGVYFGSTYYALPFDVRTTESYNQGGIVLTHLDDTRNQLTCMIDQLISYSCTVLNIVLVPYDVWYGEIVQGDYTKNSSFTETATFKNPTGASTTYYTPKNKKMYCYPYKKILLSNNNGVVKELKWEDSVSSDSNGLKKLTYKITGTVIPTCEIAFLPTGYRRITLSDYENAVVLNDFPQLSWNEDSFTKWWAQNKETFSLNMISTAISSIGSMISGQVTSGANLSKSKTPETDAKVYGTRQGSGILSSFNSIIQASYPMTQAKVAPDQLYGNMGCSALKTKLNRVGYTLYEISCYADEAESIDNYFTMFGYATKKIKKPNVFGGGTPRPYWNYVKTSGAKIHGNSTSTNDNVGMNSDDIAMLTRIFDHGITFWNRTIDVGDYSQNNAPT